MKKHLRFCVVTQQFSNAVYSSSLAAAAAPKPSEGFVQLMRQLCNYDLLHDLKQRWWECWQSRHYFLHDNSCVTFHDGCLRVFQAGRAGETGDGGGLVQESSVAGRHQPGGKGGPAQNHRDHTGERATFLSYTNTHSHTDASCKQGSLLMHRLIRDLVVLFGTTSWPE